MRFIKKVLAIGSTTLMLLSAAAHAVTEVQWWHAKGGVNGERVDKIASDFNASQSQYKIVPVYKGNYTETMTAAIAAFRAKSHPHIVQVFEVGTATMMAAKGAVYPVEQVMKMAGEKFDKSDFLPAVISYYQTPQGELLSMPFNSSTPVLWYNADALKKAGVGVPITWAEMKTASEKLVASGMDCGFSFGWQSWVMVENYSAWHNLEIGTKENGFAGLDTKFSINNNHVKRILGQISDWSKTGLFKYGGRRGDSLSMFTNGECAMWMNSSAYYGSIKKQAKFNYGQSMLPLDTEASSMRQNSVIDQETGYVPITKSAYELSKKQGFYQSNPGTDTAILQLNLNQPTPNSRGLRFGNFVQIRDIINEEMEAIWNGSKSSSNAMDAAAKRGNALLRKFERANR